MWDEFIFINHPQKLRVSKVWAWSKYLLQRTQTNFVSASKCYREYFQWNIWMSYSFTSQPFRYTTPGLEDFTINLRSFCIMNSTSTCTCDTVRDKFANKALELLPSLDTQTAQRSLSVAVAGIDCKSSTIFVILYEPYSQSLASAAVRVSPAQIAILKHFEVP